MIVLEKIPDNYKSDHLFLLVGMNPLPNYVAARLLTTQGSNVYLLHTAESGKIAGQIRNVLKARLSATFSLFQIDRTDGAEIRSEVEKIVERLQKRGLDTGRNRVGLNYTSGTAAMSVHVYHALEEAIPSIVCSYLDAWTLALRFDGRDGEQTRSVPVGQALDVSLDDLARLHGYASFTSTPIEPTRDPRRQALARAIMETNLSDEGRDDWVNYVQGRRGNRCSDSQSSSNSTEGQNLAPIPDLNLYPNLASYAAAVREIFGPDPSPEAISSVLGGNEPLIYYQNWFQGFWLEEYTLATVESLGISTGLAHLAMGVKPKGSRQFELDVVAMRGYQMFAISCQTGKSTNKAAYKEHLLEAYVRARQLGGDEARVALVCRYADSKLLEKEVQELWFTEGRVRVFGLSELPNLADHLRVWFETANS